MELFGTLVLAAIVLALLFLLFRMDSSRTANMPPGPTPLPVVGNLLQLSPRVLQESFMKLKDTYGPVMTIYLGSMRVVVLVGFEAVHEALVQQADVFAGRGVSPLTMKLTGDFGLIQSNGERWKQIRRFSLSTMRDFGMGKRSIEEWIQEEAKHLTEEFRKTKEKVQKEIDMVIGRDRAPGMEDRRKMPYTDAVLHEIQRFVDLVPLNAFHKTTKDTIFRGYSIPALKETYGPVMTVHLGPLRVVVLIGFDAVHEALVQQPDEFAGRAVSPLIMKLAGDFGLIQSNGERWKQIRRFSLSTLRDFGMGKRSIEEWIQEEAKHLTEEFRKTNEKVQKEIDAVIGQGRAPAMEDRRKMPYTDAVLHEVQRFIDLVPLNAFHKTTKDTVFRGYSIPAGTVVSPVLHSVLFDKTKWATPDTFNPGHFLDENGCFKMNPAFMPFSAGLIQSNGERWKQIRRFSLSTMRDFGMGKRSIEAWIQEETKHLTEEFRKTKEKVKKEIDAVIERGRAPAMEDRRKMPYTDAVLHEVQRFIDLGTAVSPVLHSVLFDKTKWATPYTFNPGHFLDENGCFKMNPAFMPFSAGKRICAGEGLAKMELFLFFSTLLQNFSFHPTVEPDKISLTPSSRSFFKLPLPYTFFAIPR
ncbi:CP2C7 protein, partial [Polypterus senegalus]|nr:CP2C7 protein [Polypterus senegalus]